MAGKKENGRQNAKLIINQSNFCQKMQIHDGRQKTKWLPKHKIDQNSDNFQAKSSKICMVVDFKYLLLSHCRDSVEGIKCDI